MQVNNAIVGNEGFVGFLRNNLHDGVTIESLFTEVGGEIYSSSIESYSEKLGISKGGLSEVYGTKYFPISAGGDFFDVGLTTIFAKQKYTNLIKKYRYTDSYIAAEEANATEKILKNYIYFDRFNGKVSFRKSTLKQSFTIPTDWLGSENIFAIDGSLFEDNGFIEIVPPENAGGINYEQVGSIIRFNKIGKNKIHLTLPGSYISGSTVNQYRYVPYLDPNDEVYAYYGTCVGFEKEIPFANPYALVEKIKPWVWHEQKTIAVLSRDKKIAYKISLKALGLMEVFR